MSPDRFRPKKLLKQRDNQTCLPCCLLMYYSVLFPEREIDFKGSEKQLHYDSFGLYPEYYALTHAASFLRRHADIEIALYVDNHDFSDYLSSINKNIRVSIKAQPISLGLLKNEIKDNPLIVYTDAYYLKGGIVHVPHFVYVFQEDNNQLHIADPAYGETRSISDKELEDGILGLKYHMLWSPIMLKIKKSTEFNKIDGRDYL